MVVVVCILYVIQSKTNATVKMAVMVTFTATLCNVKVLFTPIASEQKQNGYREFRTPLDHPFPVLAVFCHCLRSTN